MTKQKWIDEILKDCDKIGIDSEPFGAIVETLADILEKRDIVKKTVDSEGGIIERPDSNGNPKIVKNPAVILWMELNHSALEYWRELGLTPSALKKASEAHKNERKSPLAEALAALE